jgi:hypothetical protein
VLFHALIAFVFLAGAPEAAAQTPQPTADVREAAITAGYADIAERVERAARPAVFLRPRAIGRTPSALGTSRLGGDPDLPASARWPRCKGRPQSFLAQVRVRDLPAGARELRRHGGLLLFFTHVEFEGGVTDYGLWAGDCSTVLHARPGARLVRRDAPRRVMRLRPAPVRLPARPDVPGVALDSDNLMPPLADIAPPDWEAWYEFRAALNGGPLSPHRLLGYADAPNGGDECSERAARPRRTWRHLATFGYDLVLGFEVADGGRVQLMISPADLRAGRFDRVCGTFDSA